MNRTEELTLKLLDGEITDEEFKELDLLVASDQEAAECHATLLEQEALLRGDKKGIEITEATLSRIRETLVHRIEGKVLSEIRKKRSLEKIGIPARNAEPIEPGMQWLRSRRFLLSAAALLVAGLTLLFLQFKDLVIPHVPPQEAQLFGSFDLSPGGRCAYRVLVRNGLTAAPIAGADVRLVLLSGSGESAMTLRASTDSNGIARAETRLPGDLVEGGYTLKVDATSNDGLSTISRPVEVKRRFRILVTTDKPFYQPGQTIHMRTLALARADGKPAAGREFSIEVVDPKGNKVFRKKGSASQFGLAHADFVLADKVNTGTYTVAAAMGGTRSERSVTVKPYTLPRFRIDLETDESFYLSDQTIRGDVAALYTFGRSVAGGRVTVTASEFLDKDRTFAEISGTLDEEGRFSFELPLERNFFGFDLRKGDASITLAAEVTDSAGHCERKSIERIVTEEPIRIEMIPESGTLVQGVENDIFIFTSYPDGRPARTRLVVTASDQLEEKIGTETSEMGIARIKVTPYWNREQRISVEAEDSAGQIGFVDYRLPLGRLSEAFLLRTDRAVYEAGDTARIVVFSRDPCGVVHLDVIRSGQVVLMKTLDVNFKEARLDLDLPPDLCGTLKLNAYRIQPSGAIVSDSRIIQVTAPRALKITAETNRETYRPAGEATIDLLVTDADGRPKQAALGLSAVDEAVFALSEMRPGLEGLYFALQEEILKPRHEIHASLPSMARKALRGERDEARPAEGIDEATAILFAAAEQPVEVKPAFSPTYSENLEEAAKKRDRFLRGVAAFFAYLPMTLYFLFTLPIILYAFFRPLRRRPIQGFSERDAASIGAKANGLAFWWGVGVFFPTTLLLWFVLLGKAGPFEWYGHVAFFFTIVGVTTMQAVSVKRILGVDATRTATIFRKCVALLPAAFALGYIAVVMLFVSALNEKSPLEGQTFLLLLGAMWLASIVATGAVSVAGKTLLKPAPASVWLYGCIGRVVLAGAPGLSLLFILVGLLLTEGRMESLDVAGYMAQGKDFPKFESEMPAAGMKKGDRRKEVRVRRYFPETLFWIPELITDEEGRARLTVPLADSITEWRVAMSALSAEGELGAGELPLRVFQDFFVEIDCPAVLTRNDTVDIPVTIFNYLDRDEAVTVELDPAPGYRIDDESTKRLTVGPKEAAGLSFRITALEPGRHTFLVRALGRELSDAIERSFEVEPDGRPVVDARSGILEGRRDGRIEHEIVVPDHAVDGGRDLLLKIYPGTFSQVMEGLDSIFRMPYGCFEQTTSVTYPNILALSYMRATGRIVPEIEMKALEFINLGYQRLLTFEVRGGGFEWYGKAPADPVLTAYGLMEFSDMSDVMEIDPALIGRTRRWLASRQKDDGSWQAMSRRVRHDGSGESDIALRTTAYVAWAMAESGEGDDTLMRALDFVRDRASGTEDPYTLALSANALLSGGREAEARKVLAWLDGMKREENGRVFWNSTSEGATFSRGLSLDIEATAIAAHAFLKAGIGTAEAHKALTWLVEQKDPAGTWMTTQTTVHAMRALLLGTSPAASAADPIRVVASVNGRDVEELTIPPGDLDLLRFIPLGDYLEDGRNVVSLAMNGKGTLAYQIKATHYEPWEGPAKEAAEAMTIDVTFDTRSLRKDETLTMTARVAYNRPGAAAMTIVDLGIPPGFALIPETLEQLKAKGLVEDYSVTSRQVILYCREIENGVPLTFALGLRALYPLRVKTPPSAVYPYYEPELRSEAAPRELVVR